MIMKKVLIGFTAFCLVALVARISFTFGKLNATLRVTQATPQQLAKAMLSDNFYSKYNGTMLYVTGKIASVSVKNSHELVHFSQPVRAGVLPQVTCEIPATTALAAGQTVSVLSVAHEAIRKNTADVLLVDCYLLKK